MFTGTISYCSIATSLDYTKKFRDPTLLQGPEGSIALVSDPGPVGASCGSSLYHSAVVLCSWVGADVGKR